MTDILSQEEIDALLTAISNGDCDVSDYSAAREQKKVMVYDFRRPDKFSKDHIRTLQILHETFARLATTALSAELRAFVSMHVASVDQLTYEEFIRTLPNPTTLAVIDMRPLPGSAVLEVDPALTFVMIDKLFGGMGEPSRIYRELTDIELAVMEMVFPKVLSGLEVAWSTIFDMKATLANIETNPQFAQIVPPNDMVVLITLETRVGDVEGMANLCIPYITIEPVIDRLAAKYLYGPAARPQGARKSARAINGTLYKRHVTFRGAVNNMDRQALHALKPGMKIPVNPEGTFAEAGYEFVEMPKEADNG